MDGADDGPAAASFKPKLIERILRNVWENASHEANDMYETKDTAAADDDGEYEYGGEGGSCGRSTATTGDVRDITKIQPDALTMAAELMRLFVLDAMRRAQEEAMIEDSAQVEARHVEQVLALLLLDF
ncbi:Aste57867_19027 [Aphanomyces stellatus]|uniref:Aste57867_19027 protein n=1 Tax=Aphanomyces stellatus TaxID=120398 RepID=A0A485LBJ9_9STRA|nr:hypothetical protein As57867_018963 [Aphanomyces stellatus]VFT95752.1 Aste57867_19027 [Aphanomyces stellatus]